MIDNPIMYFKRMQLIGHNQENVCFIFSAHANIRQLSMIMNGVILQG